MTTSRNLAGFGTVAAQSQSNRNKLINGGFDVWQRGTSFNSGSTYNADRWWGNNSAVTTTWSQESTIVPRTFVIQ